MEFLVLRIILCCFGGKGLNEFYVIMFVYEVLEEEMKEFFLFGFFFWVKGLGVKGFFVNVYEGSLIV